MSCSTFLDAVRDTPRMQNYIENAHMRNRNLKLNDLLALSNEYLSRSPTALARTVAVKVCRTGEKYRESDKDRRERGRGQSCGNCGTAGHGVGEAPS